MVKRRGDKKAIVAVAHGILVIAYHLLRDGASHRELGGDYFDRLNIDRLTRYHTKRRAALGYTRCPVIARAARESDREGLRVPHPSSPPGSARTRGANARASRSLRVSSAELSSRTNTPATCTAASFDRPTDAAASDGPPGGMGSSDVASRSDARSRGVSNARAADCPRVPTGAGAGARRRRRLASGTTAPPARSPPRSSPPDRPAIPNRAAGCAPTPQLDGVVEVRRLRARVEARGARRLARAARITANDDVPLRHPPLRIHRLPVHVRPPLGHLAPRRRGSTG